MKKLFLLIFILFYPIYLYAQTEERVQEGFVRSQSYTGKNSTPIKDATIRRKDGNVNPAISDSIGYFGLSMENISTKNDVFYIGSVEVGDKRKKYELFSPLPDDAQQYKPHSKLIIIMHSEAEWNAYMEHRIALTDNYYSKYYADSLKILNDKLDKALITEQEYYKVKEELFELRQNGPKLMELYLRNIEAKSDYESLDSTKQIIRNAVYENNLDYAKQLLAEFGSFEENYDEYIKLDESEKAIHEIKIKKENDLLFSQNEKIEIGLKEGDIETVLQAMHNRLKVSPNNVDFLCELGQFEEIIFNYFGEAKMHYSKALEQATQQNLSDKEIAVCHNHLGDVFNAMSDYILAEEHYCQAGSLLKSRKGEISRDVLDSYLGLGNVKYSQAKFDEALSYYKKCAISKAAIVNSKAYWQGRIGIGQVKLAKGDYNGARSDFSSILKEIITISDIDVVTLSMAYSSIIECMATIGQYQEAIDSCDAAINIIKKYSSPKSIYVADILTNQGNAYINIGKIKEGERCMNEAIDIYKNVLGEKHPNYAGACVFFANYYILIGDLKKSEEMSNKALELFSLKFGENHLSNVAAHFSKYKLYQTYAEFGKAQAELDTIRAIYKYSGLLNNYNRIQICSCEASLKFAQGEQSQGIKICLDAIDCVTKTLGKESVQLISLYDQIAMIYLEQLENEKAKGYIEKAQSLTNKIFGKDSPTAIMQQMGMGQYYINRGEYHKAFELYSRIESVAVETFGEDNYQLCDIYNMLGDYHLGQYQFEEAKFYYEKLYEIVKNTYGENHYFIADPITKIGAYYMQTGDFFMGLDKEQQAYDILAKHFEVGHKALILSQLGICSAYIQLGQYDQAEFILTELSKAVEKKLGKKHWKYADVLQIKAFLYQNKGEINKAIECVEKALEITENVFGQHHSNTLLLYQQLGILHSNLCEFPKAIEYNNLTVSIATNYYGKDNVGVVPYLLGKGQLYANLNQIKEARKIYDKVKTVLISHFGDSCKQLNSVLISEAQLLMQEGYGEQAVEILKNVEKQMISMFGEDNIQLCGVYNPLGDAYLGIMQYNEARKYYQKSLDIIKNSLGDFNVNCIYPLVGIGNICISEDVTGQQIGEASRLYRKASFISSTVYGSNNANTANIDVMLGQISLRQGNLPDAYEKFQKYSINVKQTLGENADAHTRSADAYMNMGYYYIAKANEASFRLDSVNTHHYALRAMADFEKAKKILETIYGKDCASIANSLNAIAQSHIILQQPDSAIAIYLKAADLTIKHYGKQSPLVAQAYATIGSTYQYESNQVYLGDEDKLNEAKEYYIKAITIRENSKGSSKEILMMSTMDWRISLSSIYMKLKDYDNAFRIINKIIAELEDLQLDNKKALFNCICIKANMIVESGRDTEEALELFLKAEDMFSMLTFPDVLIKEMQHSQLIFAIGTVYEINGEKNEAINSYKKAYEILKVFSNPQFDPLKQVLRDKIEELKNE